jgi:peptidoglycan/xylan/chitin deacetylase (PgdA/CDA1 family)
MNARARHDDLAPVAPYSADRSLRGKLRRRLARLSQPRNVNFRLERPMLSVTFDDAALSAAVDGARILEEAGARGTYFVAAGLCGRQEPIGPCLGEADIRRLVASGHEIGCHTLTHLDCGSADADRIERDVDCNQALLQTYGAPPSQTFSYPYGEVSATARRALAGKYRAMRALQPGISATSVDLNQLPAVGIEGHGGEDIAAVWIERAARKNAWLVLYTHDVRREPSPWGCTPQALEKLVAHAIGLGFEIQTVARALDRIGAA